MTRHVVDPVRKMRQDHQSNQHDDNDHRNSGEQQPSAVAVATTAAAGQSETSSTGRTRSASLPEQVLNLFTRSGSRGKNNETNPPTRRKREDYRMKRLRQRSTSSCGSSGGGSSRSLFSKRQSSSVKEAAKRGSLTDIYEKVERGEAKFKPASSLSFLQSGSHAARRLSSRMSQRLSIVGSDKDESIEEVDEDGQKVVKDKDS